MTLLLFAVGPVRFATDVRQVKALLPHEGHDRPVAWLHRELGYVATPTYRSPTNAVVPLGQGPTAEIVIDAMDTLLEVGLDEVQPFPALLEPYALPSGMWGVLLREGHPVILVDLAKMMATKGGSSLRRP